MANNSTSSSRLSATAMHVVPVGLVAAALFVLLTTPFAAVPQVGRPFIGALLQPKLVVSALNGIDAWPVRQAGIESPQRLVAANGVAVRDFAALQALLELNPAAPVTLTFEDPSPGRAQVAVVIEPVAFSVFEFIRLFAVPWFIGLAFWAIGLWVYIVRRQARPGRAFSLFCSSCAIVAASSFDLLTTQGLLLLWSAAVPMAAAALLQLAFAFPEPLRFGRRSFWLTLASWMLAVVLVGLGAQALAVPADPWRYLNIWRLYWLFVALAAATYLGSLIVRLLRSSLPLIRQQSRIVIFGALLGFGPLGLYAIAAALDLAPRLGETLYLIPLALFPLAIALAILRYRLPDVDGLLARAVGYEAITIAIVAVFLLLLNARGLNLIGRPRADDPGLLAVAVLLLAFLFTWVRGRAQQLIDTIFYREQADYRRLLEAFSRDLTKVLSLTAVLDSLLAQVDAGLNPSEAWVYLFDEERHEYIPYGRSWPLPDVNFRPDGELAQTLRKTATPFRLLSDEAGRSLLGPDWFRLERTRLRTFIPLIQEDRLPGWIALGPTHSGQPYSHDDLSFLTGLAGQSALAIEHARVTENLRQHLSETMEIKNLMDNVFGSIASGVITTNKHDKITLFNKAAGRMLNWPAEEVLGLPFERIGARLGGRMNILYDRVKRDRQTVIGEEVNFVSPGRELVNLRVTLSPLAVASETEAGIILVMDDLTIQRQLEEERHRVQRTFESVVAPKVVDRLLSDPSGLQLGGTRQEISALVAEIRHFSKLVEGLEPEVLIEILNEYTALGANAVLAHEGTLEKFRGETIVAFFNAPDPQPNHALHAVRAALQMQAALQDHRSLLDTTYPLYFAVGIALGDAVVGNVGTERLFNYTAIGPPVVMAERLQALAEPGQILIHGAAYERLQADVEAAPVPALTVPGPLGEDTVYQVLGLGQRRQQTSDALAQQEHE